MFNVIAQDVSRALAGVLILLREVGVVEDSRNGPVLVAPEPVSIMYTRPHNNVLTCPVRDANPFFHFVEAFWMLAGRNEVGILTPFVKRMQEYSDDGVTMNGAYGFRWRNHFGYDQLDWIIDELRANPTSRRCVLAMWDPGQWSYMDEAPRHNAVECTGDLYMATHGSKDVPCNTHVYFSVRDGHLDMMVCNRSNDALWGACGANAVHFSMLMQYMANSIGVKLGTYHQVSNNMHLYSNVLPRDQINTMVASLHRHNVYDMKPDMPPLDVDRQDWDLIAKLLMAGNYDHEAWHPVWHVDLAMTARHLLLAWHLFKERRRHAALVSAANIPLVPWRMACMEWLDRRKPTGAKT